MTQRRTLTLTDPRAIRVLAHEVRQQLMDELSGGEVLTATEAAKVPPAVANSFLGAFIKRITRTVTAMIERDDPDEHASVKQLGGIHLTDEEAEELDTVVEEALARFDDRHDARTAPPGTRKRDIYWLNLPRE